MTAPFLFQGLWEGEPGMVKIDPHQRAFRAHRMLALQGLEVDEYLQIEWVTYDEAIACLEKDRREVLTLGSNHYRGWRVSWRVEEKGC